VPVPDGVTLTTVHQYNEDEGDGTTVRRVDVFYANRMPCSQLQTRWLAALRDAHRIFKLVPEPQTGRVEVILSDRPGALGIVLGETTITGKYTDCSRPRVDAVN
jgi:hypothetical protein